MTPSHSEIAGLLARVEAATGPDRELDLDIGLSLAGWWHGPDPGFGGNYLHTDGVLYPWPASPGAGYDSFTESLDCALALVERVLPGWDWTVGNNGYGQPGTKPWARIYPSHRMSDGSGDHIAATPPLALLSALLKALSASAGSGVA